MVLRGKEQVATRHFSGNKLMRAVMNDCKRKGKDTIYSLCYISRRKMCTGWG